MSDAFAGIRARVLVPCLFFSFALASCASLPAPMPRPVSTAFAHPEQTTLGRIVAANNPDSALSGVRLLVSGEDALGSLVTLARHAQRSLDLQYYIVRNDASARTLLREVSAAASRGVRVPIVTNSHAATDAPVVHVGYARYRPRLVDLDVELYELRNQLGRSRFKLASFGSSHASLHARAVVVDRSVVLVGSMNLDPRSRHLNTEMGVVIPDSRVSAQVVALFDDVTRNSSYRIENGADGKRRWVGGSPAVPDAEGSEPGASPGLRALVFLLTPFAPEEML